MIAEIHHNHSMQWLRKYSNKSLIVRRQLPCPVGGNYLDFGHGQQFLSSLLATLILLAYLLHTLLDLMDNKFCLLRQ